MSSPIANNSKSVIQQIAVSIHQHAAHGKRVEQLIIALSEVIAGLDSVATCVDVGCGDMSLAEGLAIRLPETSWTCLDLYPVPQEKSQELRWNKYRQFDGEKIPFADQSYDAILFSDVLHHASETESVSLINEALRVSRYVVIKDHFEHSIWSRLMLQLMDIYGNWGYGVSIPKRYFTNDSFQALAISCGCKVSIVRNQIALYEHIPILRHILRPNWHFIAVLKKT